MSISVTDKRIKERIKNGEKTTIIINIKYPNFESDTHKSLCDKMNDFYFCVAEKYFIHAKNKLPPRLKNTETPAEISMNYTVSFKDNNMVCLVTDIMYSHGDRTKSRRFSQLWSIEKSDIISWNEVLKSDRNSRKMLLNLIKEKARENAENPSFKYFAGYERRLSSNFDLHNCFFVPKGICFFVNAGIMAPVKLGACNFVLPFSRISEVVLTGYLPESGGKALQRQNIVNNI